MRIILTILLIWSCLSCSSNKTTLFYGKCGKHYYACHQLKLVKDGTFEYYIFMDVGGKHILKGTWTQQSQRIIQLNTYSQPKIKKTYVTTRQLYKINDSIQIKISDYQNPLGGASISINDGEYTGVCDINGLLKIKKNDLKSITYSYLNEHERLTINNSNFDEINITVKDVSYGILSNYLVDEQVAIYPQKVVFLKDSFELKKVRKQKSIWK